jgi:cyclopropane fatty-acyl-phospholipid synthase-like methyltransferase
VKNLYESGAYALTNPTWHEEDAPWKAGHIEDILRNNDVPSTSICEVGCGTGEILLNLSKRFPESQLCGYEIARHAYERAQAKTTSRVRFVHGDILEADAGGFDVVILADVIEHVENYIAFLKRIKDVAEFKILHVPLDLSVQSVLRSRPIMNLRANVGHIHYFFKETILSTLIDCGYSIVDHRYTASRLELPNQALSSRLMRLPRRIAYSIDRDLAVRVFGGYSLLILAR